MPKLSVIVPVYNSKKYLSECLDSILNQTYKDIEIICVNDGSTDNSQNILEEYAKKDSRIRIITQENKGVATVRNVGLQNAQGEYITYVDDDDIIENNTYEEALKYINEADLVHFGIKVFGDSNYAQRSGDDNYYKIKYKGVKNFNKKIILNSDVSACNKIFKKSIIDEYNITFPDGLNYEDAEFYFKYLSCSKKAYYLDEYFYHYRRSGDSIMSDTFEGTEKAIHHLYIVKNVFEFWQKNHYIENNEKLFVEVFKSCFNFAYWNSKLEQRPKVLYVASEYAEEFNNSLKIKTNFVKNLAKKRYGEIFVPDLKFYQKIYKKINVFDLLDRFNKKYIWFLGFKFKKHHKDIVLIRRLNFIEDQIKDIKNLKQSIELLNNVNSDLKQSLEYITNLIKIQMDITKIPEQKGILSLSHQGSLVLLKKLANLCTENNLTWWLDFGTLIGAIRHEGFIPWDDDIDISMMRSDYNKLLHILDKEFKIDGFNYSCGDIIRLFYKNTPTQVDIFPVDQGWQKEPLNDKDLDDFVEKMCYIKRNIDYDYEKNLPLQKAVCTHESLQKAWDAFNTLIINNRKIDANNFLFHGVETTIPKIITFKYNDIFPLKICKFNGINAYIPNNPNYYLFNMYGDFMSLPKDCFPKHNDIVGRFNIKSYNDLQFLIKKYNK